MQAEGKGEAAGDGGRIDGGRAPAETVTSQPDATTSRQFGPFRVRQVEGAGDSTAPATPAPLTSTRGRTVLAGMVLGLILTSVGLLAFQAARDDAPINEAGPPTLVERAGNAGVSEDRSDDAGNQRTLLSSDDRTEDDDESIAIADDEADRGGPTTDSAGDVEDTEDSEATSQSLQTSEEGNEDRADDDGEEAASPTTGPTPGSTTASPPPTPTVPTTAPTSQSTGGPTTSTPSTSRPTTTTTTEPTTSTSRPTTASEPPTTVATVPPPTGCEVQTSTAGVGTTGVEIHEPSKQFAPAYVLYDRLGTTVIRVSDPQQVEGDEIEFESEPSGFNPDIVYSAAAVVDNVISEPTICDRRE